MRALLWLFLLPLGAALMGADVHPPVDDPSLCSLSGGGPRFSVARTQDIVAESEVIVRAIALREVPAPAAVRRRGATHVVFAVREVLRGAEVPDSLRFAGVIADEDAVPREYEPEIPTSRTSGDTAATVSRSPTVRGVSTSCSCAGRRSAGGLTRPGSGSRRRTTRSSGRTTGGCSGYGRKSRGTRPGGP